MWLPQETRGKGVMIEGEKVQDMKGDLIIGPVVIFREVKVPKLTEDQTILTKIGDLINIRDPLIIGGRNLDIRIALKLPVIMDDLKLLDMEVNAQSIKRDLAAGAKVLVLIDHLAPEVIIQNILDPKSLYSGAQALTIDQEVKVQLIVVSRTREEIPEVIEGLREGTVILGVVLVYLLPDQGNLKPTLSIKL